MKIIETNLRFKTLSCNNNPKRIFLHHAEAKKCSIQDIHQWHLEFGWSGCGYHFLVRKDGSIYRGRPENTIGSHCKGYNTNSLGICAEGNYMIETMPLSQKNAIIELCKYLCGKYSITDVRGHKEAPYSTNCPGKNYPLQEIKNAIKNNYSKNSNTPKKTYSINYCLEWQKFYNRSTQTKAPISEDNIYGQSTQKSLDSLLVYIKQSKKYKYCLEFQKFYNKITQTGHPIIEDGYWGSKTQIAYIIIERLIKGEY